jgi:type IV fimbrial biogenesis protein FimT
MSSHRGFTLIEMLATIAVMTMLVTLAAPSFREMAIRNRLVTYANDLISSANFARSEAVRRGLPVTLCPSITGTRCSGRDWNTGWIAFVNADDDNPATVDAAGEPVLRVHEALSDSYTMYSSAVFVNHVTYRADGSANDAGVFALCHDADPVGSRAVILTQLRPRVATDTDNDRIPNTDSGNITDCVNP